MWVQMESLQLLSLSRTNISDDTINAACKDGCPIAELTVAGCSNITPAAMTKWDKVSMFRQVDSGNQKIFNKLKEAQDKRDAEDADETDEEEDVAIGVGVPAMGSVEHEPDAGEGDGLLSKKDH